MEEFWGKTQLNKSIEHMKKVIEKDEEQLRELQSITPYPDAVVRRINKAKPRKEYYGYFIKIDKKVYEIYDQDWVNLSYFIIEDADKIALANGKDIIVEIEKPFQPSTYKKLSIREVFDI